ncbi:fragment of putative beta-agarase (glycoside hydrolase family 50 protein) [Candidatus Sulfopaludibacter sp. SbA6]|nr:fragment of putative beta-agarase (glycoside hydrolase family 50 protein) [Candidatus Sulfopaludibacter sp. SbA6]
MRTAVLVWCGIVLAAVAQVESVRLVCSFQTPAEVQGIKATGASARRVAAHATEGRYALEVRFEAVEESRIDIPVREGDWRGYGSVALDATNACDDPVLFSVEVRDQAGAGTVGRTWWELAPGEKASFALSLNAPPPMQMGMQGEPPVGDFRILRADHQPVDLARIAAVRISMSKLPGPRTVVFDNFRLGPAVSYEKIVDRFGQYTRADWPGKLNREADLKSQLAEEQAELKAQPAMPDRDEYGGWAAGPRLEANGYFHTVKRDGKWWLVTPSGHLFFSLGLDSVNATEGGTVVEGREQMFEWLPGEGDPLAAHYQAPGGRGLVGAGSMQPPRRAFSFYTANLERKYGKDWYASWQAMTVARLSTWGFNTVGNWSDRRLYDLKKVPYVGTLSVRGCRAKMRNS